MRELTRWPLLLAAVVLTTAAVGLDVTQAAGERLAVALIIMAATAWGAFLYAEGARHREWWSATLRYGRRDDYPANHDAPAAGVEPGSGGEAGKLDPDDRTARDDRT